MRCEARCLPLFTPATQGQVTVCVLSKKCVLHRTALRPYAACSHPSCARAASEIARHGALGGLHPARYEMLFVEEDVTAQVCVRVAKPVVALACKEHHSLVATTQGTAAPACAAEGHMADKAVPGTDLALCAPVQVQWLPAVGPAGENLIRAPAEPRLAAWWRGPCVLDAIDAFAPPARNVARPLRLPVAEVGKGARGGTAVSGKLEAGALRVSELPV